MDSSVFIVTCSVLLLSVTISYYYMSHFGNKTVSVEEMANNGLIFVSTAAKAHVACVKACRFVKNVLYVKINKSNEESLPMLSKQIVNVYSKVTSQCGNVDVRLMLKTNDVASPINISKPLDLVLYDSELSSEVEILKKSIQNLKPECTVQKVDIEEQPLPNEKGPVKTYEYVALGGTFDRLHDGHKILLSQAALRATKHLTVGVTDVNMIQSKKLFELIEPVHDRIKAVLNFLSDVKPGLEYNVLPIQDIYGPTKDDPRFQLLVLSEETVRGGEKVNEKRQQNGLPTLETYVIGLAADSNPQRSHEEEHKVSSSNQRMRLLGTLLKPPMPNPNIPDWPYVIGLAGGIASGKSNIAEKLRVKGAAIINCDIIAHDLYKPGQPLNSTIADTFGSDVITGSGEVDRRKLGQIVFSNKGELEKLNMIIWPAVIAEARRRVELLGKEGHRVVVIEAAVMVRAKWYTSCHQLWAVVIPPEEAIKRLKERNGLSEDEAKQRIASQPSNLEQVAHANIVFSPYWSYEYTQKQIDRAWEQLQMYLDSRK